MSNYTPNSMEDLIITYPLHFTIGFLFIVIWTLTWKGMGLWKAAQNKSKPWFIAILVLNTMGILPIIYIFISKGQNMAVELDKNESETLKDGGTTN